MALDPNDPTFAPFAVPSDLVWPPPEYAGLLAPELAVALPEYSQGLPPPPPPPPPPVQRVGPNFVPSETAGPVPTAQPEIEMPPDPIGPSIGAPRQPTVANVLGEIAQPVPDVPVLPTDAISGADPAAVQLAQPADPWAFDGAPSITDEDRLRANIAPLANVGDERRPDLPDEYLTEQELGAGMAEYAQRDPAGFAAYLVGEDEKKRRLLDEKAKEAIDADVAWRQANIAAQRQARAEADKARAAVDEESSKMASDGGFWDSRSDLEKVVGLLAIGVGAFVAGPNKPNQALEIWNRSIERHIASARQKIADKKSSVGQMYQRLNDDYLADEAMRAAAWKGVESKLAAEEQLYDPRGTTARRIAAARLQATAQAGEAMRRAQEKTEERFYKAAKFEIDRAKASAEVANLQLDAQIKQRKLSGIGSGGGGTLSGKFTPQQLGGMFPGSPVPPVPMTVKEFGTWLETTKKGQDVAAGGAVGSETRRAEVEREIILPDGRTFIAKGDMGGVESLRKKITATRDITRLMDEALRIRTGWTSDTVKSDEWRQLKANWASAIGQAKDVLGLGALSGPDMELVEKFIGTNDPTEFRDPEAGITKARDNLIRMTASDIESRGGPKGWTIPKVKLEAPVSDEIDKAYKAAKESKLGRGIDDENPSGFSLRELGEDIGMGPTIVTAKRRAESENAEGATRTQLNGLYRAATEGKTPDDRKKAIGYLQQLAENGPSDRVKAIAAEYWKAAIVAQSGQPKGGAGVQ